MFEKCVCGKTGNLVKLLGDYVIPLCPNCINEWTEYSSTISLAEEYFLACRLLERAMNKKIYDLRALIKSKLSLESQLHQIAKAWVGERRAEYAK